MSLNQSRAEKSESTQYRRLGRSGSSGQPRNSSGGSGKGGGGGTAPPPPYSSNRSFKKPNNAQGGQSRVSAASVNSDSNTASAARTVQNGAHLQHQLHGESDAPVTGVTVKQTDMAQKSTRAVPKAPSSHSATVNTDITSPATPAKAPGAVSRSFPLQFGSISPGFINDMQIPARTSSAPPNLDEQKRDQAHHDSLRAVPTLPIPSATKEQPPKKDAGGVDQANTVEALPIPKAKKDIQVSSAAAVAQTQKPSAHPITGISMPMPFNQPQIPAQGMAATSMPMQMPMPLPIGNPQVQQQVFVSGLPHIPLQPQGIMHQGPSLNFSSPMGRPLHPQLSNVGINITPQFPQQQTGKFGGPRKPIKITHPETHEELRLDRRTDMHMESGSSGPRSNSNMPHQSQPIPPFAHHMNYYPNSYDASPHFFPAPSSLPLTSTQIAPGSQPPRFNYTVSRGPQTGSFTNRSALNSFSINKTDTSSHVFAEASNLEHSRDAQNSISSAPASVQVTVKPAADKEKVADSSLSVNSAAAEKGPSPKFPTSLVEVSSIYPLRDSESSSRSSSQKSNPGPEPTPTLLPAAIKQSAAVPPAFSAGRPASNTSSSAAPPLEESTSVVTSRSEGPRREISSSSDSFKDQQKKPGKKGHSQPQHQVGGQLASNSSLPSHSLEQIVSFDCRTAESIEAKTATASSGTSGIVIETTGEPLLTSGVSTCDASDSKIYTAEEGSIRESLETIGCAGIVVQTLDIDHRAQQDERLRRETAGTKEQGETVMCEGTKQDENSFETSSESISSKSPEIINQIERSPVLKLTTSGNDVQSLEIAQREIEAPAGCCKEDDKVADNSLMSTSKVLDTINAETSSSTLGLCTTSHGDKTVTLDVSSSRSDSMGRELVVTEPGLLDQDSILTPSASEVTVKHEEGIQNIGSGPVSVLESGSKDKPVPELYRTRSIVGKGGKKKRKEILQKADAAGTTSDLYMAYKGPEEKKGTVLSSEITSTNNLKQVPIDSSKEDAVLSEISGQSKAEPDDWEDAADLSTPKLETLDNVKQVSGRLKHHGEDGNGVVAKKYSRDFLLKFSEQCTDLPEGFDTSDIAEVVIISNVTLSSESYPSPGRINDRSSGGSRTDRRGRGMGEDEKWSKFSGPLTPGRDLRLDIGFAGNAVGFRPAQGGNYGVLRNPGVQTPGQYGGGILSGPMHSMGSQGGMQRNSPDSDRWQRATAFQKGLIPSPQTPLQVMHRAERKYQVGKVNDEEEAKQRRLKAILNKLTPQNFEKLFKQVKAVNIDTAVTLTGVISQIFDKALMEPTFCEMYADFCYHLSGELPDFSEDNEKITFKRLLLNKCQEEFERGEREQEEANRAEEEGEVKQSEEAREEKRIQARRRMLGNIRLIGELYKKRMLTERIMHECIKKLLGQYQNPDEEDIEALCKLMSTIGEIIDHPKAKEHMDAYFDMMERLSNNMKLSSRVRFMLRDAIDLRKNKWQQRRKVEGPKKIDEVHRDAAQERQTQASRLARGPSIGSSNRRGQPMDFGPRGSNMLFSPTQMGNFRGPSTQLRGYGTQDIRHGTQDVRMEERQSFENRTLSVPLPQRPIGDDSITLGPQGGLARGMSFRGQPSMASIPDTPNPGESRRVTVGLNGYDQSSTQERNMNHGNRALRNPDNSFDRSLPTSPPKRGRGPASTQNVSLEKVWPEERLRDMSMAAIKEFYSAKDEKEVVLCVKDLNAPSFYPSMVSIWVTDSFERKDMERDLLAKLLINLAKSREIILSPDQLAKGFESVLNNTLEDAVNDAPKAPEFLGHIFAKVILENLITFSDIAQLIHEGGEEQGRLVEMGLAAEVVGSILDIIKLERGESVLNEIHTSSRLPLEKFRPPDPSLSRRLDKFIGG
ncbi:eukaryotic translation initiation factor 4G-like [Cornus florida]|uniref:eukaryotic translation initiation factor 4G-like n=1 Tax=Cornus florida TaxID=4283 RepID=UPI00289899FF|nr:eukaryotic translation initiation factor 4G-like [Cornus florida]